MLLRVAVLVLPFIHTVLTLVLALALAAVALWLTIRINRKHDMRTSNPIDQWAKRQDG